MSLLQRLPSLQDAIDAGLIPTNYKVLELKQLAAIVLIARIVRRETWRESKLLEADDLRRLPLQPPPVSPGSFSAWLAGSKQGMSILEHVTDKTQDFRDVFVSGTLTSNPSLFGVESAIEELVPAVPPAELECVDLRETGASAAYRGEMGEKKRPNFHGFDFDNAYDQAKEAVIQLYRGRGRIVRSAIVAYAWPMLSVRINAPDPEGHLVILPDREWNLHALTGSELMQREKDRE